MPTLPNPAAEARRVDHLQRAGWPGTLLPSQQGRVSGKARRDESQRQLMAAVLEDAVEALVKCSTLAGRRGRKLARETWAWFESDDRTWPFSVVNITEALDIDLPRLRAEIAQYAPGARPDLRVVGRGS